MENYSLSDLAAVTGEGMGNNWIMLILFALIFGWGGNGIGNRNSDFGQYATAASQQDILFGQKFSDLDNKIDRLGNGICDSTYALNNTITSEGRNLSMQIANAAADANAVTVSQTQKILDTLAQNKIDSLQARVNQLETQNMFCGIPRINPYGYNVVPTDCGCNNV